ncbi:hypothetical protein C1H46_029103 [Malus baccata]|uniref:Ubiquitin-like domain-containing protein n=1 Tax=Malus baccata TaxID=106549 RepID=A0A540LFW4_MALBA|nr:hypothetical protein C1H46_029103 [Malus baccata]
MMKRRSNANGRARDSANSTTSVDEEVAWEMRPGGMLVQKRGEKSDAPAPNLRLRIAFGALRYEISASAQSTFGELKKVLTAETGLQPGEQRLLFRGKERENGEYLDMCGVKDRSKVVLVEDPASIERRAVEMRRNAKIQAAHRAILDVSREVDKLAEQLYNYKSVELSIVSGYVCLNLTGELKKVLTAETGLQPGEQRLLFRGKERENGEYLDMCGVKDRSKVVLVEDPASIERRAVEMRRNAKIQAAHRAILDVSREVDKLAEQVSAIEKSISNRVKVPELQITTLIEMLMRLAIKLDNISAKGDASAQKNLQGKRVQKCVESLDVLKISNAKVKPVVVTTKWEPVVTTKWETFDPPTTTAQWELFD